MSTQVARLCHVSGRVQRVFFRASTRQRAQALGVTGYARNLADGRVEVLACGPAGPVRQLCDWLWVGPPSAQVTRVDVAEIALESLDPVPTEFAQG